MKLKLGCGNRRIDGYIGLDRHPCTGADVLGNLACGLPFRDDSISAFLLELEMVKQDSAP